MICLDANVLIEIILERKNADVCRQYIAQTKDDMAITLLSLDLIMYYAECKKLELLKIEKFTRLFIWLPLTESDANWAYGNYEGDDFEDALQIACAIRESCDRFVTLDKDLEKKYKRKIQIDLLG